jgi:hypothetical protein
MDDSGGFGAPPPPPPPSAGGGGGIPQRGLGDILSAAFDVYKANAAQLITIVAVVVVPLSFISHFLTGVVFKAHETTENVVSGGQIISTTTVSSRSFGAFVFGGLIAALIVVVISAALQAALTRGAALATVGERIDVEASYRYGFRRFGSVFWISLLIGLIVAIGFILFIIPGIIFLTMLAVAIPALIVENRRGTDALGRSWNLVKGHFWHVLGTIVVAFIITIVVSAVIGLLGDSNWFLQWIFGSIAQIITAPFTALVSVLLYIDLRARVEGLTGDRLRADLSTAA